MWISHRTTSINPIQGVPLLKGFAHHRRHCHYRYHETPHFTLENILLSLTLLILWRSLVFGKFRRAHTHTLATCPLRLDTAHKLVSFCNNWISFCRSLSTDVCLLLCLCLCQWVTEKADASQMDGKWSFCFRYRQNFLCSPRTTSVLSSVESRQPPPPPRKPPSCSNPTVPLGQTAYVFHWQWTRATGNWM